MSDLEAYVEAPGRDKLVKEVRRQVVRDLGVDRRSIYHCAYWILGRPRG